MNSSKSDCKVQHKTFQKFHLKLKMNFCRVREEKKNPKNFDLIDEDFEFITI